MEIVGKDFDGWGLSASVLRVISLKPSWADLNQRSISCECKTRLRWKHKSSQNPKMSWYYWRRATMWTVLLFHSSWKTKCDYGEWVAGTNSVVQDDAVWRFCARMGWNRVGCISLTVLVYVRQTQEGTLLDAYRRERLFNARQIQEPCWTLFLYA